MSDTPYNPNHAWRRATVYFGACILIAVFTGTWSKVLTLPLVSAENLQNPNWIIWTVVCFAIIGIGYLYIWPLGTKTHGRPLVLSAVIPFGLAWGISEGLLFASVWSLVFRYFGQSLSTVVIVFLLLSTFIGLWHQFYWDIWVAPDHNIIEWNGRKVAFAHTPNLIATLIYLTLYQNLGMMVIFQTIALLSSTYFMRFPPYRRGITQ
jgi:hypothetical protein